MGKTPPAIRHNYPYFVDITTRWKDNDVYGHINNVTYYSYFDTAANTYLIEEGGLHIYESPVIGVAVESKCSYHSPLAYPDAIEAGLRADHVGNRSVTYGIGIFKKGQEHAAANGYFVHVFVDRETMKPAPIPDPIRTALQRLRIPVDGAEVET
jgi:acyl-CoA thioester hydrolase